MGALSIKKGDLIDAKNVAWSLITISPPKPKSVGDQSKTMVLVRVMAHVVVSHLPMIMAATQRALTKLLSCTNCWSHLATSLQMRSKLK